MNTGKLPGTELEQALDAALARTLAAPCPSTSFRVRLRAEIARTPATDLHAQRTHLEHELEEQLRELRLCATQLVGRVRLPRL